MPGRARGAPVLAAARHAHRRRRRSRAAVYEVLRATDADAPLAVVAAHRARCDHHARPRSGERSRVPLRDPVRPSGRRGHGGGDRVGPRRRRRPPTPRRRRRPPRWSRSRRSAAVRLSWTPSPDPDVVGYVVYRATPAGPSSACGSCGRRRTTFTDRDVAARQPTATRSPPRTRSVRANESVPQQRGDRHGALTAPPRLDFTRKTRNDHSHLTARRGRRVYEPDDVPGLVRRDGHAVPRRPGRRGASSGSSSSSTSPTGPTASSRAARRASRPP